VETNELGKSTSYTYDLAGQMTKTTDPLGNETSFTYDLTGRKVSETDALGYTTTYRYDAGGRLTSMVDALGETIGYAYDAAGNKISETDKMGQTTFFYYDSLNQLTSTTDPLANSTSEGYDELGRLVTTTDSRQAVTAFAYDAMDRVVTETTPNLETKTFSYDEFGNVASEVNENGDITRYAYDEYDQLVKVVDPRGKYSYYDYDLLGNQIAESRELDLAIGSFEEVENWINGVADDVNVVHGASARRLMAGPLAVSTYRDLELDLSSESTPTAEAVVLQAYVDDAQKLGLEAGFEVTFYTGEGLSSYYHTSLPASSFQTGWNSLNLTKDIFAGHGSPDWAEVKRVELKVNPAIGQSVNVTFDDLRFISPRVRSWIKTYDAVRQVIFFKDAHNNITTYAYDAAGQPTAFSLPSEKRITLEHDAMGRHISTTDELGTVVEYEYDSESNREKIITPAGVQTVNHYDPEANLEAVYNGLGSTAFDYSPDNNLTAMTYPNTMSVDYNYDAAANLTALSAGSAPQLTFDFDSRSNLVSGGTTTERLYAEHNRLDQQVSQIEASTGRIQTNEFDEKGNLVLEEDVIGQTSYTYDARSFPESVVNPQSKHTAFNYDAAGRLKKITGSNGIITDYGYDADSRKTGITAAGGAFSLDIGYGYDDDAQMISETVNGTQSAFAYDGRGRLTAWTSGGQTTTYSYGLDGDRTAKQDAAGITTYLYDTQIHQLVSESGPAGDIDYAYDTLGQLVTKTTANGTTNYSWNDKGQLLEMTGETTATFSYDPSGNRIEKNIGGRITRYVYDGLKLIAEKDASGATTAAYTYDTSGRLISVYKNQATYYFHLNHRGDVLRITDENKNMVAGYIYDPWGNILSSSGSFADEQPFRYAGYLFDEETGLYFLQARYYDPTLGRFISRDPDDVGDITPSINPYVYAEGNPLSFVDPTGNAIELTGHPKNAPHLVKRLRLGLSNMGYFAGSKYEKNTWDKKLAKAVKQFKRTHLGWKNGKTYPLSKLYGNDGHVNNAVWDVFEYWDADARREQRNDFFSLHGRVSPKKTVAVYAVMDKGWRNVFNKKNGTGLDAENAAGKQAIRRRFNEVNSRGFPGGAKFRVYDIEYLSGLTDKTEHIDQKLTRMQEIAGWDNHGRRDSRFQGYEVLAGFIRSAGPMSDGKPAVGIGERPGDALIVKYQKSHFQESQTLAHELGHIFGAHHHNEPVKEKGCGNARWWSSTKAYHGTPGECIMNGSLQSHWPPWCPHHEKVISNRLENNGW
jgi:RHS repeat-associated protein